MKFPFFATFIVFVIWLNFEIARSNRKASKHGGDFWEKEIKSNNVRRKKLDSLDYIHIPEDQLPFGLVKDNPVITSCEESVHYLATRKIVNLTGITNTDLKLKYGTANITELSEYDQSYTVLACRLNEWGKELYDLCMYTQAQTVLEFAVRTRTDVSETYHLLCDMYSSKLMLPQEEISRKLKALLPVAGALNSLSKTHILEEIEGYMPLQ